MTDKQTEISTLPSEYLLQGNHYRYTIKEVLGSGAFGITYRAELRISGELGSINASVPIAIKEFFMHQINGRKGSDVTVSSADGTYEYYKKKFAIEAKNLSQLHHTNIIKVLELFECNNTVYYSMEFLPGGSLDAYIQKKGRLEEDEALRYTRQVGGALSYMHSRGMLHMDLKPSNIMLNDKGEAVLIDFGLAKHFTSDGHPETSTSIGLGTPGYSPLEQAAYKEGEGFPATIDVYALGATLYKMLTGVRPPDAADVLNDGLSVPIGNERIASCIKKAMFPVKKKRYQSVMSLINGLTNFEETAAADINDDTAVEEKTEDTVIDVIEDKEVIEDKDVIIPKEEDDRKRDGGRRYRKFFIACVGILILIAILLPLFRIGRAKPSDDSEIVFRGNNAALTFWAIEDKVEVDLIEDPFINERIVRSNGPMLGYAAEGDTAIISARIKHLVKINSIHPVSFVWDKYPEGEQGNKYGLLLLNNSSEGPAMDAKNVSHFKLDENVLHVHFNKSGTEMWKHFTQENVGKLIAIVVNNKLVLRPRVVGEITSGMADLICPDNQSADDLLAEIQSEEIKETEGYINGRTREYHLGETSFLMTDIEGGTFNMGNDKGSWYPEKPVHEVSLKPFTIGQTEVTQALWQEVMGNNPSETRGNPQLPVDNISYTDCIEFIGKLNDILHSSGQLPVSDNFRLPTEAEWEFAARGGTLSRNFKYSGSNKADDVAWYYGYEEYNSRVVGTKRPNELGLYDMSGNVSEWVHDWYDSRYYNDSPKENPSGPAEGSYRCVRGGAVGGVAVNCLVYLRAYGDPGSHDSWHVGLRLAL